MATKFLYKVKAMIRLHFNNSTNIAIALCKVTRMKALTLSEAARRNFFEIQNSSSELKVCLEVLVGVE